MRNGPNGEFQFTPMPTEIRGRGLSPRKISSNFCAMLLALPVELLRFVAKTGHVILI